MGTRSVMAEKLRYKRQGLTLRAPRIDFAAQEASARGYAQISANLDRLSGFFFSMAENKAQIEGAEYGATNAPTRKQLMDAKNRGEPIDLSGDQATVFGRAARKASMEAVSDELTYLAKRDITNIITQGINNNTAPNAVSESIDSVVAGYASTLDGTDPAMARHYRANLSIYGNAEYEAYSKQWLNGEKTRRKTNWEASWQLTKDNLGKIFAGGKVKSGDGREVALAPTAETIAAMKEKLLIDAASYYFSAAEIEALANEFDDAVIAAATNTITDAVIDSDNSHLIFTQIESGSKMLPESVQAALGILDGEQRLAAIREARQVWRDSIDDENTIRDFNEARINKAIAAKEQDINEILFEAFTDPLVALKKFKVAVNQLAGMEGGAAKALEYQEMMPTDGQGFSFALKTEESTRFMLDTQINDMDVTLTLAKLDKYLLSRTLSYADWKSYSEIVRSRQTGRFNDALIEVRKRLALPVGMVADRSVLNTWQWNTLNKVEVAMRRALREAPNGGRDFDAMVWLDANYDTLTKTGQEDWIDVGLGKLSNMTRASVEAKLNAAVASQNQADIDHYTDLLKLADDLEAAGKPATGF